MSQSAPKLTAPTRIQRRRRWYNRLFKTLIGLSGISVVLMLAALFIYLFSEVLPLFRGVKGSALAPVPYSVSLAPSQPALPGAELMQAISPSGDYVLQVDAALQACLKQTSVAAGCIQQWRLSDSSDTLTSIVWMSAGQALLAGYRSGRLQQWFLVADAQGQPQFTLSRELLAQQAAIVQIASEQHRRGFATLNAAGQLAVFYSARGKPLWQYDTGLTNIQAMVFSADNQLLSLYSATEQHRYALANPHPEISWQTLWHSVWYEGFAQPETIWQTSSAADDYQPKFSLIPLTSGTLKAAFYATIIAAPLAIMAAIYCACFLPAKPRRRIKSLIELMAAFPTVILGFIAAVWLAPVIEQHLLGLALWLLLLPLSVLLLAALWPRLPKHWQQQWQGGREVLLLMLWIVLISLLAFTAGSQLDSWLFTDGLRFYLDEQGIYYEQRNALIVGIAMGFAVIPGIFAIAEDVLQQVPSQLTRGALALGATPWQAVLKISLPLAAPGLIAASLVGFGRAIGETMIVLMATGNSPVSNFNIFEGLRSLTATLAIELPEATVGSSHFRVLFVAALLLLLFTFVANTAAEIIRQRLRKKYQRL